MLGKFCVRRQLAAIALGIPGAVLQLWIQIPCVMRKGGRSAHCTKGKKGKKVRRQAGAKGGKVWLARHPHVHQWVLAEEGWRMSGGGRAAVAEG